MRSDWRRANESIPPMITPAPTAVSSSPWWKYLNLTGNIPVDDE